MTPPDISWLALLPVLIVLGTGLVVLLADLWIKGPDREGLGWIGIIGLLVAAIASATLWNTHEIGFGGTFAIDRYTIFFNFIFAIAGSLTLLMSMDYLERTDIRTGEYYALTLFAIAGMLMMAGATDLIVIFLGLEVMSIAVYCLAGISRRDVRSNEAAIKYFLLGAFATGFLLFGIALIYGACGATTLGVVGTQLAGKGQSSHGLIFAGIALLLVGFAFKIAAVPFHAWAPDVYQGAPTSVTALMAVGVKAAAFAAFARIFLHTLAPLTADWETVMRVLAVLTMTVGNVIAISQKNIKRLLAYSSISHAGYILIGMVAAGTDGGTAVLYYLLVYSFMTLGAFAVVIALGKRGEPNEDIDDYAGLGFKHPFLAFSMTVFMLSLAGVPTLAGFTGKFYLFTAAVDTGHIDLAVVGVLNSVLSMYYYLGVPIRMYMADGSKEIQGTANRPYLIATLLIASIGTVFLGLFPSWAFELARSAYLSLG